MTGYRLHLSAFMLVAVLLSGGAAVAETYEAVGTTECKDGFTPLYTGTLASGYTASIDTGGKATIPAKLSFGSCKPESANAHASTLKIVCALCKRD